jgi:regulatory protein
LATRRQRTGWQIGRLKNGAKPSRAINEGDSDQEEHDKLIENRNEGKPQQSVSREKAREKMITTALRMLTARARSENQLREKLLAKEWLDHSLLDECIARLKELGYINDRSFAHNYALSRLHNRAIGKSRLARELTEKKVSREIIEQTLETVFEEVAEDDLLEKAIEKHIRLHGAPNDPKSAKRIFAHLMRRGFQYDLIARRLRSIRTGMDEQDI